MKLIVPVLGVLLLTACAGPRPAAPTEAKVTAPEAWRTDSGTAIGDIDTQWWQAFGNATLTQLVRTAFQNNLDLAMAVTRVAQARAQFRLAEAQRLPDVTGDAGSRRDRDVNPGFGVPEVQTAVESDITISYDLDLFGRLASMSSAARARLLSSEAMRDDIRLSVAASTAGGYITLCALQDRLNVLRLTLDTRGASLQVIRRQVTDGYASQLDLDQAEADYQDTQQLIPSAELAISQEEDGLSIILGSNPQEIVCDGGLQTLSFPAVPNVVPASLLRRRPDIMMAEENVVAADRALDSARAAFMPDVQISASGGVVASTLIASPVTIWSLGNSILAPIFDGGRLQAGQEEAAAARDSSAFAYRKAALTAFGEVENQLASVQETGHQERTLETERDILARTLRQATSRYRAGYSPYLDQLDAQRTLLGTELKLVQSRADRLTSMVKLYQAIGGGWRAAGETDGEVRRQQSRPAG